MSRRRAAQKRQVAPDFKFGNNIIAKFVNVLMWDGKRSLAERIFYDALSDVKQKTSQEELEIFLQIIDAVKPSLEVRSRRIGGATYQVPVEVADNRSIALAIRWVIQAARRRKGKTMRVRLREEFLDILSGRGEALKMRETSHKMAEANRAFAHFRW